MNYHPTTNPATGLLSRINWKMSLMVLAGVALVSVLTYFFYRRSASNTSFHANRENIPKDAAATKTATLMLFYATWCPHCKTAKPEWDALKEERDGTDLNGYTIHFAEYDCANETAEITQLVEKYHIEGFPTIKLIKDNQIVEYNANPTKATMEQFLNTVL